LRKGIFENVSIFPTEFKKRRLHIKKKSEQVLRLRKKLRKSAGSSSGPAGTATSANDHSAQRLSDSCTKELNVMFRQLHEKEKKFLRIGLIEERNRLGFWIVSMNM
jgi:cell division septum initiation protein DivIVA